MENTERIYETISASDKIKIMIINRLDSINKIAVEIAKYHILGRHDRVLNSNFVAEILGLYADFLRPKIFSYINKLYEDMNKNNNSEGLNEYNHYVSCVQKLDYYVYNQKLLQLADTHTFRMIISQFCEDSGLTKIDKQIGFRRN